LGRHNITVPDTISERLAAHKTAINVSRICAQAIEEELDYLDRLNELRKEGSEMDQLIERLRKEKSETAKEQFDHGLDVAKEWVESAHFSEIRKWAESIQADTLNWHHQAPYELPEDFVPYRGTWWEGDDYDPRSVDEPTRIPGNDEEWIEFSKGFYTALLAIWETIEDKI